MVKFKVCRKIFKGVKRGMQLILGELNYEKKGKNRYLRGILNSMPLIYGKNKFMAR